MNEEKIIKIINSIRPYLLMENGDIEFLKYENNYVYIKLSGACQNCAYNDMTINQGIYETLKKEIPEIKDVINLQN